MSPPPSPDPVQLIPALTAVEALAADPQLLVDLFVNYDCALQAANLYERTCRGLARIAKGLDPALSLPVATASRAQQRAVAALQAVLRSLDSWAGPIKEAALAASAAADDVAGAGVGVGGNSSNTPPPRATPEPLPNEAERFEAVKEKKHSLEAAVALFNRKPIKGVQQALRAGLVADEAGAIAAFLKQHASLLDKEMLGEYFGHHEQPQIDVMHAYIDLDRYAGMTIDNALRRLLSGFRLPGESQKIDRIMEKFAERYCKDNPVVFRNAGDAYILAFAIIMLNTDAHNPMAERRLANTDFILMNQTQVENGDFEPILPEPELQAIFDRITSNEIQLPDVGAPTNGKGAKPSASAGAPLIKLAASLGITQLLQPFKSGSVWDKQHGVDVERKWLLEQTRALMAQGGATGLLWHHASHSEHARPMLQVTYGYILRSVAAALKAAGDAAAVGTLLESLGCLVRLCGVLGLQTAMEEAVEVLEDACGVTAPAAPGTLAESKQVAALATLLSIAGGSEGALLGAGWYRVLRVLSGLQALQQALLPQAQGGALPSSFDQPLAPYNARTLVGKARRSGLHTAGGMSRLMSMLTQRSDSEPAMTSSGLGPREPDSPGNTEPADVALEPGHGLVVWSLQAVGEGLTDGVYLRSCGLDGDAVIAFFRALCAVSHKELTPSDPHETPRVYGVRQLVECMILNMGRIRLVLSRIWGIVAPHLVSAACAPDARVAKYAVEALQRLIDRLLLRAELANFTYQEEALRPFVSVLRHCDGPTVREFAVRCIAGAITAHPRGLGSGWRSLLQALTIAASDHNAAVVNQALDALQPVVEALYRGWQGHAFLNECVDAIMAAVANRQQEELSTSALFMLQSVARRLAAATGGPSAATPTTVDDAAPLAAHDTPFVGSREASDVEVAVDGMEAWCMLMHTLGNVARLDHRARVADTAAQVAFDILQQYSSGWDAGVFKAVVNECVLPVFDLPHRTFASFDGQPEAAQAAQTQPHDGLQRGAAMALSGEGLPRVERQARRQLGQLWELGVAQYGARGGGWLQPAFALLVRYVMSNEQGMAFLGLLQLQAAVDRLGAVLDSAGWQTVVRTLSVASCTDHLLTALDPSEALSASEARAVEDVIRCRCALVVCCQRLVAEVVSDWQHTMPAEHQLQLLGVLKDSVDRAMAFNGDAHRRAATAAFFETLHARDKGPSLRESPAPGGRPSSRGSALAHELSAKDAEAMGHSLEAVLGARRPPRHPAPPSPTGSIPTPPHSPAPLRTASPRPDTPGSVGSSQRQLDVSLVPEHPLEPAMLRQEIEGGLLLIQGLLHMLKRVRAQSSGAAHAAPSIPPAVGAAAESLLLEVCRAAVGTATADVLAAEQEGVGAPHWETALRSPLTVHALRGYLSLELDALHDHLPAAFRDLATLARSPDITVRREVQALMETRIGPMVAMLAR